jgi:TetR/AcrR family transcriptional regulator
MKYMAEAQKKNQSVSTKEAILEAAEKLFVENGYAETSISRIAKEAGVTKSLIHHHFGSKQELLTEVKRIRFGEYYEAQREDLDFTNADVKCLVDAVTRYFEFLRRNPDLVRLISWHIIEPSHHDEREGGELARQGAEKIAEAQAEGIFRNDVDAKHVLTAFFCLVLHWFQAKHEYLKWFGEEPDSVTADSDYFADMLKILLEGVLPR